MFSAFTGGETGVRTVRDLENQVQGLLAENNQLRAHLHGSQQMMTSLNQRFYPFLDMLPNTANVHTLTEEQRQRRRARQSTARQRRQALRSKDPALNARVNRYEQAVGVLLAAAVADCQVLLDQREAFRAMVQEDEIDARNKAADRAIYRGRLETLAEQKAQAALEYKFSQMRGTLPAGTAIVHPRRNGTRFITGQESDEEEGDEKEGNGEEAMEQEETAEGSEEAVESDEATIAAEEEESSEAARNEESAMTADAEDL